jgi:hypothetical protein
MPTIPELIDEWRVLERLAAEAEALKYVTLTASVTRSGSIPIPEIVETAEDLRAASDAKLAAVLEEIDQLLEATQLHGEGYAVKPRRNDQ